LTLPIRGLLVPRGDISPHAGVVLFRAAEGGDALALLVSELPEGATLIVLDRCMVVPGADRAIALPGHAAPTEVLVLGRVERGVPRGHAEDSQPRPNWYPVGGQLN
jgi:hypothetical protein